MWRSAPPSLTSSPLAADSRLRCKPFSLVGTSDPGFRAIPPLRFHSALSAWGSAWALAEGRPARMADLDRWLAEIDGRGACSHPDGVARQILTALEVFHDEVVQHEEGWCTASGEDFVLPLPTGKSR